MPSKYDTNPLDPDFPARAKAAAEAAAATRPLDGADNTSPVAPTSQVEERTRRFADRAFEAHQNVFNGSAVPTHSPAQFASLTDPKKRKVDKIGLPENIATALPYFPWYIGLVAGLVLLLLLPRGETKVRFHAAQGLAAHLGILLVTTLLGLLGNITSVAEISNVAFQIAALIFLLIFFVRALRDKPIHIESLDGITDLLDEKVGPHLIGNKDGNK